MYTEWVLSKTKTSKRKTEDLDQIENENLIENKNLIENEDLVENEGLIKKQDLIENKDPIENPELCDGSDRIILKWTKSTENVLTLTLTCFTDIFDMFVLNLILL